MGRVGTSDSTSNNTWHDHEDLYEAPADYVKPYSEPETTQQFPPKHEEEPQTQQWPPKQEEEPQTQQWPPPQEDEGTQVFPPPQPNVDMGFVHIPQQQQIPQPMVGGTPVIGNGMPSSSPVPLIGNQQPMIQAWKTDLCDCCLDPTNAIITLCFPCITFGQIAEILDGGQKSCGTSGLLYGVIQCCLGIPCIISCSYRSRMRSRFGLMESPCSDCLVHCCCEYCALCQEYRELKERGLDPSIGYLGNVARLQKQQQFGMTPPMQQRMM